MAWHMEGYATQITGRTPVPPSRAETSREQPLGVCSVRFVRLHVKTIARLHPESPGSDRVPARTAVTRSAIIAALVMFSLWPAFASDPLPTRDDIIERRLENGLRVILAQHPTPPGRVVAQLVIRAGSLHERDEERAAAHFIQHMAFHGSSHFPDGSVREVFQSLGLELDKHDNASTAPDHTAYTLSLPNASEAVLAKGLAFLADVLAGLHFPEEAVRAERNVLLDELRQLDSPERRVFLRALPRLTTGSKLAERLPLADAAAIGDLTRDRCRQFYSTWYTPSNATLILTGDLKDRSVQRLVREYFADIPDHPAPPTPGAGVNPPTQAQAILETDPELSIAMVAAVSIDRVRPAPRDTDEFRTDLVDQLVQRLINRRLDAAAFAGDASSSRSGAYLGNAFGGMWIGQILSIGDPSRWSDMLADLTHELERARRFGFTEAELELTRDAILTEAETLARRESTLPSDEFIAVLTAPVLAEAPLLTGEQNLALVEQLLGTISAADATKRFSEVFQPDRLAYLVETPPDVLPPNGPDVLAEARRAASAPVQPPQPPRIIVSLIPSPPAPTGLTAAAVDGATGVMTMSFSNGFLAHHRRMTERAGRVLLRATMAGGEIEEDATTHGLTRAVSSFFSRPAFRDVPALSVRDFLSVRGVSMRAHVSMDAVTIMIEAPSEQVETAFQLLRLALTAPVIEPASIADWKQRESSRAARRLTQPRAMLERALADAIAPPEEVRIRPITADEIERIDTAVAQRWLDRLLAHSPMEFSIVGELDRPMVAELAGRYLGDLPSRPAIAPSALADRRAARRFDTPRMVARTSRTLSDQALVAIGFFGPDETSRRDVAAMNIVERMLRPQLVRRLRDEEALVSSIEIINEPARALPGYGIFLIVAPTSAEHASEAAELIERELSYLVADGPGQADIAIAQTQLATSGREALADPEHWSRRLADLAYRGRSPSDLLDDAKMHDSIEPAFIRDAMARHAGKYGPIRILIAPEADPH